MEALNQRQLTLLEEVCKQMLADSPKEDTLFVGQDDEGSWWVYSSFAILVIYNVKISRAFFSLAVGDAKVEDMTEEKVKRLKEVVEVEREEQLHNYKQFNIEVKEVLLSAKNNDKQFIEFKQKDNQLIVEPISNSSNKWLDAKENGGHFFVTERVYALTRLLLDDSHKQTSVALPKDNKTVCFHNSYIALFIKPLEFVEETKKEG